MGQNEAWSHQISHYYQGSLCTDGWSCAVDVDENVKKGFASIGIKISDAFAELVNVGGEKLIGVGNAIVQIRHFVISVASKIMKKFNSFLSRVKTVMTLKLTLDIARINTLKDSFWIWFLIRLYSI